MKDVASFFLINLMFLLYSSAFLFDAVLSVIWNICHILSVIPVVGFSLGVEELDKCFKMLYFFGFFLLESIDVNLDKIVIFCCLNGIFNI